MLQELILMEPKHSLEELFTVMDETIIKLARYFKISTTSQNYTEIEKIKGLVSFFKSFQRKGISYSNELFMIYDVCIFTYIVKFIYILFLFFNCKLQVFSTSI